MKKVNSKRKHVKTAVIIASSNLARVGRYLVLSTRNSFTPMYSK